MRKLLMLLVLGCLEHQSTPIENDAVGAMRVAHQQQVRTIQQGLVSNSQEPGLGIYIFEMDHCRVGSVIELKNEQVINVARYKIVLSRIGSILAVNEVIVEEGGKTMESCDTVCYDGGIIGRVSVYLDSGINKIRVGNGTFTVNVEG